MCDIAKMDGGNGLQKSSSVAAAGQTTHPKAWQQLWLDKHRETLLARLQSVVMSIVDRLVQEGHVNPALDEAYQFIAATHSLPVEKVRRLLDSLRSRSQKAFTCFLAALSDNGCEDLVPNDDTAQELEIDSMSLPRFERCSLELGVPACVVQVRRLLHAHYSEAANEVHMMVDVFRSSDGSVRDLNDVFVNIALVSSEDVEKLCSSWTGKDGGVDEVLARASQSKQINLSDLLTANDEGGKDPVRLVAVGAAGSGKSFAFTMKATHDWCGGEFWEKFALLRTIRCRDKAKSISEIFQLEDFGLSSTEEAGVQAFIAQQPWRVVLVCDGLDEGSVDEGSFLWRIMTGKSLRGLRVIITSRPCSAVASLSESGAIHRHVQMTGFSKENVDEFVVKYLGESQGREMLSQLAEQSSVASLMHTPFFALLICEQFKEVGQLPRRRSDVFSSVTLRLVQRFAKRRGLGAAFKRLEKAPGKLFGHVLEVGKVAFDRLKNKDLSYFELEGEELSPEAVELGFLEHVRATSLSEMDQYGFRHLTVQEYLAALYACSEVVKKAGDVARLAEKLGCGPKAGHLNTFWVFVAGLLDSSGQEELFEAIAGVDIETEDVRADIAAGSSSAENAQMVLFERSGGDSNVEEGSGEHRSEVKTASKEPLLDYRFLLLLHCYNEATIDSPSNRSVCVMDVLKRWQIYESEGAAVLSLHDASVIFRAIACHSDVVEKVDLSSLTLNHAGLLRILPALNICARLKELHVDLCLTNCQIPIRLGGILSRHSKRLEMLVLSLGGHRVEGGIFDCAEDKVDHAMQQLECLELSCVHLTGRDRELGSRIRPLPALRKCVLTRVFLIDSAFTSLVAPALRMCKRLQTLVVHIMYLTGDRMAAFASMLTSLPQLEILRLGYDPICDEDFSRLAPALGRCSQLRRLHLLSCGLTSLLSMALLTSVLPCLHHLQMLHMDRNEIGDAGLAVLLMGLEECSQLSDLSLAKIGLTSPVSLLAIANLLGRLVHLVSLDLSGNKCSDMSSAIQLCNAVEQHSSLETLHPPDEMDDDIAIWLESLLVERTNRRPSGASGDVASAQLKTTQYEQ